jgi:hypothetical protein
LLIRDGLYLDSLLAYLGLTVSTGSLFSLVLLAGIFVFYRDPAAGRRARPTRTRHARQ